MHCGLRRSRPICLITLTDMATKSAKSAPAPALTKTEKTPLEDHRWHLAVDEFGVAITDLEYAVMRLHQSFLRWQAECINAVSDTPLSGQENALLHIIRMHERPKTIKDLQQIANRQDVPNMQYELRKLIKAELVEKYGTARSGIYYVATAKGAQVCEDFAKVRSDIFLRLSAGLPDAADNASQSAVCLEQMEKVYESATREIATFYRKR